MDTFCVSKLRCEYLSNPLGIDECVPRLSWQLESDRRGAQQTAYRILVASHSGKLSSEEADLWDSGLVVSNKTTHVEYAGKALSSREHCYWLVEVTDEEGTVTCSEVALWTMGLLSKEDWTASWIAADPEIIRRDPDAISPSLQESGTVGLFRREFKIERQVVARAILYVTARGLFEIRLNNQCASNDLFAPEWTDYDKRIQYRTYDVTRLVHDGDNCIAAALGDGWWSGFVGWQEQRGRYGSLENSLLAQLEIEYADGSIQQINTDSLWHCETGPIIFSDFMMGETYDARREKEGWDCTGFSDGSNWLPAVEVAAPEALLVAQSSEPVKIIEELTPVSMTEIEPGIYIYDLGQNISGWVRLSLPALPAGTRIVVRHGERVNPDGTLHTTNLRRAKATDTYISRGGEPVIWQPNFTFHGFQYVEITGLPDSVKAELGTITGCVIHSATPPAGHFECSNPEVNRLWLNAFWSQKDNFISVPTDCPQRDERLGWTGDAQVFLRTATCNMDVAAFFTKWMVDIEDAQTPEGIFPDTAPRLREDINFVGLDNLGGGAGWADAGVIVPFTLWRIYGDSRILQKHYSAMVSWVEWIEKHNSDGLRLNELACNYGDWLCIPTDTSFGTHSPMKNLLATAFWADDCAKLSRIAAELGKKHDERRFRDMFEKIRQAFQQEWLLDNGRLAVETQTAYLLALAFDLLPKEVRGAAAERLVEIIRELDWHLNTGFIGVGLLNPQLTLAGRSDVAYRLLLQDTYPAWLYPVKHGATTIWERWNGWTEKDGFYDPFMNSFNHYSLGSVVEWLFRHVAGIELDTEVAGSQSFLLCPYIDNGLEHAGASLNTMHGEIKSYWKKKVTGLTWTIRIPANTEGEIRVPCALPEKVFLDGELLGSEVADINYEVLNDRCCLTLPAGEYEFRIVS